MSVTQAVNLLLINKILKKRKQKKQNPKQCYGLGKFFTSNTDYKKKCNAQFESL